MIERFDGDEEGKRRVLERQGNHGSLYAVQILGLDILAIINDAIASSSSFDWLCNSIVMYACM